MMDSDSGKLLQSGRAQVARAWRVAPVTTLLIAGTVALFLTKVGCEMFWDGGSHGVQGSLGAVVRMIHLRPERPNDPQSPLVRVRDFDGPFDLWGGQWWRIPVSGFHHAGLLHLAMNVLGLWFFGKILEPRLRSGWFLCFFLVGMTVSLLPEFLSEHDTVGISGGLCALFGMLLVLRSDDRRIREELNDGAVKFVCGFLIVCVFLTAFGVLAIANVAHFSGLAYGWIAGEVFFGRLSARRVWRNMFVSAHLAIPLAFYTTMHPWWNGRYYAHRALAAYSEGKSTAYEEDLKQAVKRDPGLVEAWMLLAEYDIVEKQDWLEACRTALTNLRFNRSDPKSMLLARKIFQLLASSGRGLEAQRILKDTFGDEAVAWDDHLRQPVSAESRSDSSLSEPSLSAENDGIGREPDIRHWDRAWSKPSVRQRTIPGRAAGRFDPDAPESAAEGQEI